MMFLLFSCMRCSVREFYEGGPRVLLPPTKWSVIAESLRNTDLDDGESEQVRRPRKDS
jgi:hypothetical protein